jgi:hypothetical protein
MRRLVCSGDPMRGNCDLGIGCRAVRVEDAVLRCRIVRAKDTPCQLSYVSALVRCVYLEFDPKTGLASGRRISTRQRRHSGNQSYNSGKPNTRTSYSNKKWMDRTPNSQGRWAGDRCNDSAARRGCAVPPKENFREPSRGSVGGSQGRSAGVYLARDHVIDIFKSKRYRDGAIARRFRVEPLSARRARSTTITTYPEESSSMHPNQCSASTMMCPGSSDDVAAESNHLAEPMPNRHNQPAFPGRTRF